MRWRLCKILIACEIGLFQHYPPKATELLRRREMSRCAISNQTHGNIIGAKRKTAHCGGLSKTQSGGGRVALRLIGMIRSGCLCLPLPAPREQTHHTKTASEEWE